MNKSTLSIKIIISFLVVVLLSNTVLGNNKYILCNNNGVKIYPGQTYTGDCIIKSDQLVTFNTPQLTEYTFIIEKLQIEDNVKLRFITLFGQPRSSSTTGVGGIGGSGGGGGPGYKGSNGGKGSYASECPDNNCNHGTVPVETQAGAQVNIISTEINLYGNIIVDGKYGEPGYDGADKGKGCNDDKGGASTGGFGGGGGGKLIIDAQKIYLGENHLISAKGGNGGDGGDGGDDKDTGFGCVGCGEPSGGSGGGGGGDGGTIEITVGDLSCWTTDCGKESFNIDISPGIGGAGGAGGQDSESGCTSGNAGGQGVGGYLGNIQVLIECGDNQLNDEADTLETKSECAGNNNINKPLFLGLSEGNAESACWKSACCGDDSEEHSRIKEGDITNSNDKACCDDANDCVLNGICRDYDSDMTDYIQDNNDAASPCIMETAYCGGQEPGEWSTDGDLAMPICGCLETAKGCYLATIDGHTSTNCWNSQAEGQAKCCGDDSGEVALIKTTIAYCEGDNCPAITDKTQSCCDSISDCVYDSNCYNQQSEIATGLVENDKKIYCSGMDGWEDCDLNYNCELCSQGVPQGERNLILNPDFEKDWEGWGHYTHTAPNCDSRVDYNEELVTSGCLSGNCAKLSSTGCWQGVYQTVQSQNKLEPGETYTLSVRFKTTSNHQAYINLHNPYWKNSEGVVVGKSFTTTKAGNNDWQTIDLTITIPRYDDNGDSTENQGWRVYLYGHHSNLDPIYYDQVQLEKGSKATSYSGEIPGEYQFATNECCGDDENEYKISGNGKEACCDDPTNCVDSGGNCRNGFETGELCFDGIDNDCDGYIDDETHDECWFLTVVDKTPTGYNVPVNNPITITFSDLMDIPTMQNAVTIKKDGIIITSGFNFVWNWVNNGHQLTINFENDLTSGATYSISVDGTARKYFSPTPAYLYNGEGWPGWEFITDDNNCPDLDYGGNYNCDDDCDYGIERSCDCTAECRDGLICAATSSTGQGKCMKEWAESIPVDIVDELEFCDADNDYHMCNADVDQVSFTDFCCGGVCSDGLTYACEPNECFESGGDYTCGSDCQIEDYCFYGCANNECEKGPLVAEISVDKNVCKKDDYPCIVNFEAIVHGGTEPYRYAWDFEHDGTTDSRQQNYHHTFLDLRNYLSTLTVTDAEGKTIIQNIITRYDDSYIKSTAQTNYFELSDLKAPVNVAFYGSASSGSGQYDYRWEFGDGTTSSEQNPTHTYTKKGNYNVILTVMDDDLQYAFATIENIKIEQPLVKINAYSDTSGGSPPLTVQFSSRVMNNNVITKYSYDNVANTNSLSIESCECDTHYGTLTCCSGQDDGCYYNSQMVTLTVDNGAKCYDSFETQGGGLWAIFEKEETKLGDATISYNWNFGDGTTSSEQDSTHTYSSIGTYFAEASVSDGFSTAKKIIEIKVGYPELEVGLEADKDNGAYPLEIEFDADVSGGSSNYISYKWDFGDSKTETTTTPTTTHLFESDAGFSTEEPREYNVLVTVTDSVGNKNSKLKTIQVHNPLVIRPSANKYIGEIPVEVSFDSGIIKGNGGYSFSWDFKDPRNENDFSYESNPIFTYQYTGTYQPTLEVYDQLGEHAAVNIDPISVGERLHCNPNAPEEEKTLMGKFSPVLKGYGIDYYGLPSSGQGFKVESLDNSQTLTIKSGSISLDKGIINKNGIQSLNLNNALEGQNFLMFNGDLSLKYCDEYCLESDKVSEIIASPESIAGLQISDGSLNGWILDIRQFQFPLYCDAQSGFESDNCLGDDKTWQPTDSEICPGDSICHPDGTCKAQQICSLTKAKWSMTVEDDGIIDEIHAKPGDTVYLLIEGKDCNDKELTFFIMDEDANERDDKVKIVPTNKRFGSDGKIYDAISWVVEEQVEDDETFGLEYYFIVNTGGNIAGLEDSIASSNKILVGPTCEDGTAYGECNGYKNYCGFENHILNGDFEFVEDNLITDWYFESENIELTTNYVYRGSNALRTDNNYAHVSQSFINVESESTYLLTFFAASDIENELMIRLYFYDENGNEMSARLENWDECIDEYCVKKTINVAGFTYDKYSETFEIPVNAHMMSLHIGSGYNFEENKYLYIDSINLENQGENVKLLPNCFLCGCAAGIECGFYGECLDVCEDNTPKGSCSVDQPQYCGNANLLENAGLKRIVGETFTYCGDGVVQELNDQGIVELCDGNARGSCPGLCKPDCICAEVTCMDGIINQESEVCDIQADTILEGAKANCIGRCDDNCECGPAPTCQEGLLNRECSCGGTICSPGYYCCGGTCSVSCNEVQIKTTDTITNSIVDEIGGWCHMTDGSDERYYLDPNDMKSGTVCNEESCLCDENEKCVNRYMATDILLMSTDQYCVDRMIGKDCMEDGKVTGDVCECGKKLNDIVNFAGSISAVACTTSKHPIACFAWLTVVLANNCVYSKSQDCSAGISMDTCTSDNLYVKEKYINGAGANDAIETITLPCDTDLSPNFVCQGGACVDSDTSETACLTADRGFVWTGSFCCGDDIGENVVEANGNTGCCYGIIDVPNANHDCIPVQPDICPETFDDDINKCGIEKSCMFVNGMSKKGSELGFTEAQGFRSVNADYMCNGYNWVYVDLDEVEG